jgi:hypothetical protein
MPGLLTSDSEPFAFFGVIWRILSVAAKPRWALRLRTGAYGRKMPVLSQFTETTVPVPLWPEFGLYPPSVATIANAGMLPEMTLPDLVIELATITVMVEGTVAGGDVLLPGPAFHVPPQAGGFVLGALAKPLNALGARPPLIEFCFAHFAPQNVTCWPTIAFLFPITKLPP